MHRSWRVCIVGSAAIALLLLSVATVTSSAGARVQYASAGTATIHPGVQTFTAGSQCTANFVFSDGTNTYIGQAAHCSGTGGNTATNGCTSGSLGINTPVTVTGASQPGVMVYNSWLTMQAAPPETDANTCQYNDLALIKLAAVDIPNVNPSIPHWGGPNGLASGTNFGDFVYSYGNSELRLGITQLSPKKGISLGDAAGGWTHGVFTVTPGIPGDSGSAFLDSQGHALGILSTLSVLPIPLANNVGDLRLELGYLHSHGFPNVNLVNGDVPFNGSALPLG